MARWALDGHLPYLSFPAEEGAALQQYSSILGRGLVTPRGKVGRTRCALYATHFHFLCSACMDKNRQPKGCAVHFVGQQTASSALPCTFIAAGVPSPRYLLDQARQLAQQLGLACPPLSPTLWLERYLAELELPQVVAAQRAFRGRRRLLDCACAV